MDVLTNIKLLLKEQHKTQKELCEFLGINKQAFTNWMNGHTKSYEKYLPQIAAFFDVSVDYLIGNTDIPNITKKKPDIVEDDRLWENIRNNETKLRLANRLVQMSEEQLLQVEKVFDIVLSKDK